MHCLHEVVSGWCVAVWLTITLATQAISNGHHSPASLCNGSALFLALLYRHVASVLATVTVLLCAAGTSISLFLVLC